ncbi:MAG TPA: glycosyltransferase family A protein [Candidatus Acidoferrum sp.]|jgi:succinoglycan biosynthesis protein ExoM|nr:glycosyltransferase family A protein [Candidatus Acidoferrum sp.]
MTQPKGTFPHITVCICTYKRVHLLQRLLNELELQEIAGLFSYSIVVADNDPDESAKPVVAAFAAVSRIQAVYCVQPQRNIALTRNKTLENAKGDFIAFIDDDEFPAHDWLLNLFRTCNEFQVAGVLGPVRAYFDDDAPAWVRKGGFYERPEHETGFVMSWPECRTGNVLLRRELMNQITPAFRPEFGTGGEDQDFFRRAVEKGNVFIWCNEAVAHEFVPPHRWERRVLIKRALLRGRICSKRSEGRWLNLAKSMVAVPLYGLALPFFLLAGHHLFMRYLVKLCDHAGRLLASLGINPISERIM